MSNSFLSISIAKIDSMSLIHPYYTVTAFFRQEAKRENTGKQALFHTLHRQVLKMGRDISWV